MLRHPWTAAAALLMAFISAAGLGAGLLGLLPVLKNILGEQAATLPTLVREGAEKAPWLFPNGPPEDLIARLPAGRFDAVLWLIIGLGVLTVIGAVANFLHAYLSLTLTTQTIAEVRRAAYRRLLHLPLKAVVSGSGSDLTSRILNDTNSLNRGLQALTSKAVSQVTRGIAAFIAAIFINWPLTLATLAVAPILAIVIRKTGKAIRKASKGTLRSQAKLLEDATEVTRGFRVVKVFGSERAELGRFSEHNREVLRESLRLRTAQAIAGPLLETITIFALGTLALIATKAIIDGKLQLTDFLLTLASLGIAGNALRPLSAIIQDIQVADAAAGRLNELLDAEPEERRERGKLPLPRHARSITFEGVSFAYTDGGPAVVDRVDLSIEFGDVVAFVGPNGCGKTTLLSLVPRLFAPRSGRVLIDGADIAAAGLRSLRRQIGVVSQETVLFRGTIAQNIAYARPGATPEHIEAAARAAHAHDFITRLPQGYETPVGEGGLMLSGGQRQRVAIARALYRDPAILIMDEATSMVDAESEAHIAAALAENAGRRTVLLVAHRMTTVLAARRVVVMDAGRIVDSGTHEELLERCPVYRDLARHQLAATSG
jgi:subfamily B ATP-binding cassette protein MsbA